MTAIILAGGKSTRMGSDKAFIEVDGVPLINRQVELLKKIFKKIIIVTNSPQKYRIKDIQIALDVIPDCGPLGGIYTGLLASTTKYNFVVACDMPFLNQELIRFMVKCIHNYDVVIPKYNRRLEPLCAIYSRNCIKPIKDELCKKNLKIIDFFSRIKARIISKSEMIKFNLNKLSFANINTKQDYQCLLKNSCRK